MHHSILGAGTLVLAERDGDFVAGKKEVSLAHCPPPPFGVLFVMGPVELYVSPL